MKHDKCFDTFSIRVHLNERLNAYEVYRRERWSCTIKKQQRIVGHYFLVGSSIVALHEANKTGLVGVTFDDTIHPCATFVFAEGTSKRKAMSLALARFRKEFGTARGYAKAWQRLAYIQKFAD
jgi:hypothetical protein